MTIATYLPSGRLTNDDLASVATKGWTAGKIEAKTGIRARAVSAPDESALDLAEKAARALFARASVDPTSVDHLLLCTQSPAYALPSTACLLHARLDLRADAGALAFDHGCSGYVYGLSLAKGLLSAGLARRVLLVTADTYTKYLASDDFATRALFGDGASATLLGADDLPRLGAFVFGTDGSGAERLIVRDGRLTMDGPEIFSFTLEQVPPALEALLKRADLAKEDVDLFVFHQANRFMLDTLRAVCQIDSERFVVDLAETGNLVSASIPRVLEQLEAAGKLKPGMRLVLMGFGVGLSWAGCVVTV